MKRILNILIRALIIPTYIIAICFFVVEVPILWPFGFVFMLVEWILTGDTVIGLGIMDFSTDTIPNKTFEFINRITPNK